MSMSLDEIWNDPTLPVSSPARAINIDDDEGTSTRPSPAKRRRTTLFLSSDSSDDDAPAKTQAEPSHVRKTPHTPKRPDIEALFDGIDDDDAFRELAPALDVQRLRKDAAQALPPLTPHALLSSSPPRDGGDRTGAGVGGRKANDKDGDGLHKRKQRPKLDEARLLGTDGFPALVKQAKHFKPRGKGHERSDLDNLIQIYQFWSHKLYPNNKFQANVQRIEQLCHTKRMMSAVGVWKDEFHGTINGHRPEDLRSDGDASGSEGDREEGEAAAQEPRQDATSSSPPRSSPLPRKSTAVAVDDDWDIDEVIREAEERERAAADAATKTMSPSPSRAAGNMAAMSAPTSAPAPAAPTLVSSPPAGDEDEAMWDEFGMDDAALLEATQEPQARARPSAPAPPSDQMMVDDEEDMWDVVRELEQDAGANTAATKATATVASASTAQHGENAGSGGDETMPTNDEGWDEMYL